MVYPQTKKRLSFFFYLFFIEVQLNYNVVLITDVKVTQLYMYIHYFSYYFPLCFITGRLSLVISKIP